MPPWGDRPPEVTVCLRCAHFLSKRAWEIEDSGGHGPAVQIRGQLRRLRRTVMQRGWHRHGLGGRILRRMGRYLP